MIGGVGVLEGLGELAAVDVAGVDESVLLGVARELEVARSLLEVVSGRVAVQLDVRKVTRRHCGLGTPRWLASGPQQAVRRCRARLRVARALCTDFGEVDVAVADGRLSWDHAEVIVRVANPRIRDEVAAIQGVLIDAAAGCVFEHWERFVVGVARQLDVDGGHDPRGDLSANRLRLGMDDDSTLRMDAELVAEHGVQVHAAIERVADELFRKFQVDSAHSGEAAPGRPTLRALALVEICRRAHSVDATAKAPINLTTMVVRSDDPTAAAYTPRGGRFPAQAVEALRCDEMIEALVVSSTGVPLHLGRATRLATATQRRVIAVRDGGCVFPGCDALMVECVLHHVDEWAADGGHTNTDRMAPLCWHHHRMVHEPDWHMACGPAETFTFTTPTGRSLHSQRHGRPHHHRHQTEPDQTEPDQTEPDQTQAA